MTSGTVKYCYTLSSIRQLPEDTVHSIRTLLNYVSPEQVVVFYTPPYNKEDEQRIRDLGVDLRKREQVTDSFSIKDSMPSSAFGEKVHIGSIEADTVVFLDCDTLVLSDIRSTIEGDFEFKARPSISLWDTDDWEALFQRFGRDYLPWMPNAGFMIFKNGAHQRIVEDWMNLLGGDLDLGWPGYQKEQYALALAVSSLDTQKMTAKEHVFEWNDECPPDGTVYHLQKLYLPDGVLETVQFGVKRMYERLQKRLA